MIVLKATGLTKVYKGSKEPALDSLTLEIEKGQIFTLLGRNGAGKTTFLRIAGTQLLPTSGSITVLGFDVVKQPKEIRKPIAFTHRRRRPFTLSPPETTSCSPSGYEVWQSPRLGSGPRR